MIYILHGDNQRESRRQLNTLLDSAKSKGDAVKYLDGSKLTRPDLESALLSSNLFTSESLVIEGLLSRPRSHDKELLINYLAKFNQDKTIILWDSKEVTKTNLTPLTGAQVSRFMTPAVIFTFLAALRPGNYHEAHTLLQNSSLQSDPAFIFIMTYRHVGNLLIASSGDLTKLSPFQRTRLQAQTKAWTDSGLLNFHQRLFEIDLAVKSGKTKLDYLAQLDLLLASLLS